jgi:hypothetical protein
MTWLHREASPEDLNSYAPRLGSGGSTGVVARLRDAACAHSLAHELVDVRRLERILVLALEQPVEPRPAQAVAPLSTRFARPGSAFDQPPSPSPPESCGRQGCLPLEVVP